MQISFQKLWDKLKQMHILRTKFKKVGISSTTYTDLVHNQHISSSSLVKICNYLNCQISDILDIFKE
ncbi:helix-turn-helix domain-containing protein [Mycoplasma sp. 4013]